MTHHTKLTSEKYLIEAMKKEARENRGEQNSRASRAFALMASSLLFVAIWLYILANFGTWMAMFEGLSS
jgi:hypothetical protein